MDIKLPEGITIEYKAAEKGLPKSFWETYSAFANTNGGVVILGYDERDKTNPVKGIKNPQLIYDQLLNDVNNLNKVSFNLLTDDDILIKPIKDSNRSLIIVNIREAPYSAKPVHIGKDIGNSYIRLGEGDRQVTKQQLKYLLSSSHDNIDSQILPNFDISDIDLETVERYRSRLISQDEKYRELSVEDLLVSIGAYKKDRTGDGKYRLTSGGLLFFGKYNSITDRFPHFQLDYFEKNSNLNPRWVDRVSTGDATYPDLNIFDFLLIVMDKLAATVKDPFILDENSKTRIPFKKDLEESLREALVNCLMHAYYDADFPIKITALPDYYEFKNPGNMRVSIDEFIKGNNSITRNPTIATLLRKIGFSEKAGSGGQKIFDIAAKHNLILPTIQSPFDSTTIIIWKVDFKHNINQLSEPDKSILEFISLNGSIKRKQIENDLGLSGQEYSYRKALDRLIEQDFIKRIGSGPGTKYILKKTSQEHYYLMKQTMREIEDALKI
ncbi:ATP-binding protein [Streptococcus halichoeri]|uniref:ATP-binding protein n=1 Tax=Streptococcus halichoeri TaxID=254785 RepID=UPI00135C4D0D|nr:ATP-binding protein [Streptococcus halichoeri]